MTSFINRTTTTSARFALSGRVQTGAAALMLSVSALAMSSGAAQAACLPAGGPGPDNVICIGGEVVNYDSLGGDDTIDIFTDGGAGYLDISGGADNDTLSVVTAVGVTINGDLLGGTGNDIISLIPVGGVIVSVDNVLGEAGNDTIILNGTGVTVDFDIDGGADDDVINLLAGTVTGEVQGGTGNDTITLNGAAANIDTIAGFQDDDTINLLAGTVDRVFGDGGADAITLDGATVTGDIFGDSGGFGPFGPDGADTIDLLGGTGVNVFGEGGNDTITLNGASLSGNISGDAGDDTIDLLGGTVAGTVFTDTGNDTVTLDGAAVGGNIETGQGNDTVNLLSGTVVGDVATDTGDDIISLDGATVSGNIIAFGGNDTINLLSGSVTGFVFGSGGGGDDTIILDGATVGLGIFSGTGNDTVDLLSGITSTASGQAGADTITLNGATVTGDIDGDDGDDVIDLLSGTALNVNGDAGADTITLNGASLSGAINGGADNDTIDLLSGSAVNANGDGGADTITLNGASLSGDIDGGTENDTIDLLSGSAASVHGGDGDDTITLNGATITSFMDADAGNDIIDLLAGSVATNVNAGSGNDTITLDGASIGGIIAGESGDDTIDLLSGSASQVWAGGGGGNDTITLDGASIGTIDAFSSNATINLLSGSVINVLGNSGFDTITLNGATVTGNIDGGIQNDIIDLLSGSVAGGVLGDAGDDTITLNGASVGGNIGGGTGNDTIDLLAGTASASVAGNEDNDTITLNGAAITGDLQGNAGNDVINLTTGTFGGSLLGGTGADVANIAATFNLATIGGLLDGGEGINATLDTLNIAASGSLFGPNVIGWEIINVNNANLAFTGAGLTTSAVNGQGLFLNNSLVDFNSNAFALVGDVTIDGTSTLQADTPGGIGVFSVSGDLINNNIIDLSDGFGAGDTLTVGGNYTSGSDLFLDVALDATEAGDSLVINGLILGVPTEITFTDVAAANPPSFTGTGPGNGIIVVDNSVGGDIVVGDFVFDPVAHPTNEILKVPFVYTLNLENDDILYLQSDVLAQIYGYAILSELMRENFPILRDRLGDIRYTGYDSDGNPEIGFDNASIWARVDGSKRDIEHDGGFNTGEWNASRGEAEIGIDIPMAVGGGVGVFGVSAHAVRGYADANSGLTPNPNVAEVDTTGFGAGLSFAWFPGGGFYADVQGRITAWDADVENAARDIDQDINGLGWGVSLEVGNRFQIATNTAIIPRSQVVYTDVDFDSFKDDDGVSVSQDDSASIVVGPGVTLEQMFPDNGVAMFIDASVKHELLDESSIDASGFTFKSGLEDTWGQVSFGASLGVAEGASAYVAGDLSSPLTSTFGDSYGYGFRAGFRIDF